ncbi:uncharacterized protein [Diadema setosum]|uniref:uncharacterized protein n=1 Tax=Diadema setosum TaxID=31175 RepID=UPI003B3B617C
MDESDVVVDQGNYHSLREADEDEISGHRAIYVGVHVPLNEEQMPSSQKKHHHHHHSHGHGHGHGHGHHKHRNKSRSKNKNGANGGTANNTNATGDAYSPNSDPNASADALLLDKQGAGDGLVI